MIFTVILILQTTGSIFGAQILLDPNLKGGVSGKKKNGIKVRKRDKSNVENKSDGQVDTEGNVREKWLVDAVS